MGDAVFLLFNPSIGTDGLKVLEEELAGLIVLSLQLLASVEVNIVLPAVPGLVLVGESWVKWDGLLARLINKGGVRHGGCYRMQETLKSYFRSLT